MAMAIIAILFPFLMWVFTGSRGTVKEGEHELIAVRLAEDLIEQARIDANEGNLSEVTPAVEVAAPDYPSYHRLLEITEDLPNTFIVTVRVEWDTYRSPQSLTLSSRVFQP